MKRTNDTTKNELPTPDGFTPVEWWIESKKNFELWREDGFGGEELFGVIFNNDDQAEPNAALIAAAPRLLQALRNVVEYLEWSEAWVVEEDAAEGNENCYTAAKELINSITQPKK